MVTDVRLNPLPAVSTVKQGLYPIAMWNPKTLSFSTFNPSYLGLRFTSNILGIAGYNRFANAKTAQTSKHNWKFIHKIQLPTYKWTRVVNQYQCDIHEHTRMWKVRWWLHWILTLKTATLPIDSLYNTLHCAADSLKNWWKYKNNLCSLYFGISRKVIAYRCCKLVHKCCHIVMTTSAAQTATPHSPTAAPSTPTSSAKWGQFRQKKKNNPDYKNNKRAMYCCHNVWKV